MSRAVLPDSLKHSAAMPHEEPVRDGGPQEAAHYIKGATAELAVLARAHGMQLLAYLLDMAHGEAETAARTEARDPR